MDLSVATIVKNEEKNLRRMLESLEPLKKKMDIEIIIVDTGSTDNTISIAREYTDKVYEHKWTNDFAEIRNISLSYCTGKWILVLDADEELCDDGIVKFIHSNVNEQYNSAYIVCRNYYNSNLDSYFDGYLLRVFKNTRKVRYEGIIHEQPIVMEPYVKLDIMINHYGYLNDDCNLMIYKYERNIKLLQQELQDNNDNIEYVKYQMCKSYYAFNMLVDSIAVIKDAYYNDQANYRICMQYVMKLYVVGEYISVIKVISKIPIDNYNIDVYFYLGSSYYKLKQYNNAIREFEKYIEHKDDECEYELYSKQGVDNVLMMLIESLYYAENYSDIERYYNLIEKEEKKKECLKQYIYSIIKCNKFKKIYINKKNIEDEEIEEIINAIKRYNNIEKKSYVILSKELLGINKKLDYVLETIYLHRECKYEIDKIDLTEYFAWKGKLIKELVVKDYKNISLLVNLKIELMEKYIYWLGTDYYSIRNMYKYSKDNIFNINTRELRLLVTVERALLLLKCIDFNDYENLIYRTAINSMNYTLTKYNKHYVSNNIYDMDRYEAMWFKIRDLVRCINKKEYIEKLKRIVEDNKEYARMLKRFNLKDATVISDEMIEEKNKILEKVEKLVVAGNIKESLEVLKELLIIFNYDEEVLMNIGVVYYIMGNIDEAMRYLIKAYFVDSDNVDIRYNLGCVLEAKGYKDRGEYLINNV